MERTAPTRRQVLQSAALAALTGCADDTETPTRRTDPSPTATEGGATATATRGGDATATATPVPAATVADWLVEAAVPLGTTDPDAALDPGDPLRSALADATVVGLGESTHGTREFFRLKHRLLRFLVAELGVRLFAMETNFSETLALDGYVRRGEGDLDAIMGAVHYWAWDTQAVRSMVEWMRSFNEGRPPADRVRFHGFDVQYATGPARRLGSYLEAVDLQTYRGMEADLTTLARLGFDDDGDPPVEERLATARTLVADLEERFARSETEYVESSSEAAFRLARRHLWTLDRARRCEAATNRSERATLRDRGMAATVSWLLDHEGADGIALWGHNSHVGTSTDVYTVEPMGSYLREAYGDGYHAVGFEFGHGSFRSRGMRDGEVATFTVEDPPADSLSAALSAVADSPLYLDLGAVENPELAAWLDRPRSVHGVGTVFDPGWSRSEYADRVDLGETFDALVCVRESSPTRPG